MVIKPIRSEKDHERALRRLEKIFNSRAGTPEADEEEVLSVLIDAWERENIPIRPPGGFKIPDVIAFYMEAGGRSASDLEAVLGPRQRVHDVMTGKRDLSKAQIRALHIEWGIPLDLLFATEVAAAE